VLDKPTPLVCIVAISPTRGSEVRNYCRRLRANAPGVKILVLRPTLAESDVSRSVERLKESGADCVVTTTQEALEAVSGLLGGSQREVTGGGRDGGDGGDVGDVGDEGKKRVATI
jgi:hypothetical protein